MQLICLQNTYLTMLSASIKLMKTRTLYKLVNTHTAASNNNNKHLSFNKSVD